MALEFENARYGAEQSRRLLITTIHALGDHAEAMTVVGAHAVHVWVKKKWGAIDMESTRDGDLVLNPLFIAEDPKIMDLMAQIGLEPVRPERPGIYGPVSELGLAWEQRTTVDLLVPEIYAGAKGRSARILGQGRATTRAIGLELAIHDRTLTRISTSDNLPQLSVDIHVAGPAALLIAKAHKVSERLAQVGKRPDRLRPKDSGDIALLMMVSNGAEIASTMKRNVDDFPEIRGVVDDGVRYLFLMYAAASDTIVREHMAESLSARFPESVVLDAVDAWLAAFATS